MNDATQRVTQWIIGIRGAVPLVEALATAEDVHSFVCGHVRWSVGTPGRAIELEDIDWTTVEWHFVLKVMHAVLWTYIKGDTVGNTCAPELHQICTMPKLRNSKNNTISPC